MANHVVHIANPTEANVTVNSQTAVAGAITKLTVADSTTDLYFFLDAGCVAAPYENADAVVVVSTAPIRSNVELVEEGARILESLIRESESEGN